MAACRQAGLEGRMAERLKMSSQYQKGSLRGWVTEAASNIDFSPLALRGLQPLPLPLEVYKVKHKKRRTVYRTRFPGPDARLRDLCIKNYGFVNHLLLICGWLFGSYAQNSWKAANLMLQEGIGTPRPIALLETGSFGKTRRRFFITVALKRVMPLERLLLRIRPTARASLIQQLAAFLGTLHEKGFYHADLKANNILVEETSQHFDFYLVDLDRTRCFQRLPFFILDWFRLADLRKFFKTVRDILTQEERKSLFNTYFAALSSSMVRKIVFRFFL